MKLDYLKGRERLVQYALFGIVGVSAVLMLVKVADYFLSSAEAQSIVEDVISRGEPNEAVVKEKLSGLRQIADALKKSNLFAPPPPRQHPVKTVQAIMGDEVLIGEVWYKVGGKIGDATVVAIEPTQVKIEWDGQEKAFAPISALVADAPQPPPVKTEKTPNIEKEKPTKVASKTERVTERPRASSDADDPLAWLGVKLSPELRDKLMKLWSRASEEERREAMKEWNNASDEKRREMLSELEDADMEMDG
ncbi:MAG: hypothetical protein JXN61_15445 [Sedimentisphaerales bacterium]|nr:hypothetical protein [Sedimentisphaerales bacterium]